MNTMNTRKFQETTQAQRAEDLSILKTRATPLIWQGIALAVLGAVALSFSIFTTFASIVLLGMLLFACAAVQLAHAFSHSQTHGFWGPLFTAILYGVGSFLVLKNPAAGALAITFFLAPLFMVSGIQKMVFALSLQFPQWGWLFVNGIVAFTVGILIFNQLPSASLWVVGTLIGVEIVVAGISMIAMGYKLRSFAKVVSPEVRRAA
jgi:uncharacterized membrane protein HdeD (DUF308 family)